METKEPIDLRLGRSSYEKDIAMGNVAFHPGAPSWEEWDGSHLAVCSIRIHEKAGFRTLGVREKIGKQNGIWRDMVLLERRSKTIII